MVKRRLWILLALVPLTLQIVFSYPTDVKTQLSIFLQDPRLKGINVGVDVELLGSHKQIFSYNASHPMIPASNMKIITSGCALERFGPDYRFLTTVRGNPIQNGIMDGNLILKGSGDPTWNGDFYPNATSPLDMLAQKLKEEGLREVTGDLVVDDSIFDHEFIGYGWKDRYEWDDYASEAAGLSLNYNQVVVSIVPGFTGGPAQITLWPDNQALLVINHAVTTPGPSALYIHRDRLENEVTVSGRIGAYSKGTSFTFNIHDPPLFVGSAFKAILKKDGIDVLGGVREIRQVELGQDRRDPVLASLYSPPLLKIIHDLNKNSVNFLAEHLFRALAASRFGKGTIAGGDRAVCDCLTSFGIRQPYVVMADGSGLSSLDRVSPHTLVTVLQSLAVRSIGPLFKKTLPVGGVDGTLEGRLSGVHVEAKTGAIRHVSSLSGYVVTRYGQTLVFSIILNNFPYSAGEADDLIDEMVRIVAAAQGPL